MGLCVCVCVFFMTLNYEDAQCNSNFGCALMYEIEQQLYYVWIFQGRQRFDTMSMTMPHSLQTAQVVDCIMWIMPHGGLYNVAGVSGG